MTDRCWGSYAETNVNIYTFMYVIFLLCGPVNKAVHYVDVACGISSKIFTVSDPVCSPLGKR